MMGGGRMMMALTATAAILLVLKNKKKILVWMKENNKKISQALNRHHHPDSSRSNSCAAAAANIPSDFMAEILSRLPVESVFRFRSVCKEWRSLTCEPYFLDQYNKRSSERPPSMLVPRIHYGKFIEIYELGHDHEIRKRCHIDLDVNGVTWGGVTTNQVNGLVVLYSRGATCCHLLNPATRELSEPLEVSFRDECATRYLAVGLGFDISSGKYKLVKFYETLGSSGTMAIFCKVLTVGSRDWRSVGEIPYRMISCRPFFLNGALYWMVAGSSRPFHLAVLVFDMKEEKFRFILTSIRTTFLDPEPVRHFALREFDGQICIVETPILHHQPFLKIWMLRDGDVPEWKLEYNVDVSVFPYPYQFESPHAHIISIGCGKILMQEKPWIFSYDVESKVCRKIYEFEWTRVPYPLYLTAESLVSPKKLLKNNHDIGAAISFWSTYIRCVKQLGSLSEEHGVS